MDGNALAADMVDIIGELWMVVCPREHGRTGQTGTVVGYLTMMRRLPRSCAELVAHIRPGRHIGPGLGNILYVTPLG